MASVKEGGIEHVPPDDFDPLLRKSRHLTPGPDEGPHRLATSQQLSEDPTPQVAGGPHDQDGPPVR